MHEIVPKPSRLLGLLLLGMAGLSITAIIISALPAVIQILTGLLVMGLSVWGWQRASVVEVVRVTAGGMLQCQNGEGEWQDVEVLGDSLVSLALIVLRYRHEAQYVRTLVLLPDSVDAESMRRLRVSLRWARHTRSDTAFRDTG
ncbi:MAG: hypothetical protein Q8K52_03200 [Thiobacillus sp.]|nr:hypothetical protein [Thiobacillus sp.]